MKLVACLLSFLALPSLAQFANSDILPPAPPWSGKSRALTVDSKHAWATPFEKGGLTVSPSYEETMAWLERLVDASPELHMSTIGHTLEGRAIKMIIASKDHAFTPSALKATGKPLLLAHAGIHAGEIDGKDAGMMLLRDMTVRGNENGLLDGANFVFIPILSADGHERSSAHGRINQRGPEKMGWRTNGRNLNLNRDFAKLETVELQALIPIFNRYKPDLYFDIHVTDGIDYQYDITYGYNWVYSPKIAQWLETRLTPYADRALKQMDHVPGPLIFAMDNSDLSKGIVGWSATPRFSNGYGDLRHLPTILVENHSLKPYDQRVLGTYVLLKAALAVLAKEGQALRDAIHTDQARRPQETPLAFGPRDAPEQMEFLGIAHEKVTSEISGATYLRWLGKPETMTLPHLIFDKPTLNASRPKGYWVPADWPEVIEKLRLHGIDLQVIEKVREETVQVWQFDEVKLAEEPFEGRARVSGTYHTIEEKRLLPAGSAWVSTDQPLGTLAMLLLEPDSPDSFWQWGYFLEVLQRTEYFEVYALEPLAEKMLAADPELKRAFEKKVKEDEAFAADPRARLNFFYSRSPYMDHAWMKCPVTRQ